MSTRVVNVGNADCEIYVGRRCKDPRSLYGEWFSQSEFANPFKIPVGLRTKKLAAARLEVIEQYRKYLRSRPDLIRRARILLKGRTLGCWCSPEPCHADVLAEIAEGGEP